MTDEERGMIDEEREREIRRFLELRTTEHTSDCPCDLCTLVRLLDEARAEARTIRIEARQSIPNALHIIADQMMPDAPLTVEDVRRLAGEVEKEIAELESIDAEEEAEAAKEELDE